MATMAFPSKKKMTCSSIFHVFLSISFEWKCEELSTFMCIFCCRKRLEILLKHLNRLHQHMEIKLLELLYGLITSNNHESSLKKLEATINHNTSIDAGGFNFFEIFYLLFIYVFFNFWCYVYDHWNHKFYQISLDMLGPCLGF